MKFKEKELTNEGLSKLFKDNFELAITAIRLAQSQVESGHEVTMQSVLAEIRLNPQHYIDLRRQHVADIEKNLR